MATAILSGRLIKDMGKHISIFHLRKGQRAPEYLMVPANRDTIWSGKFTYSVHGCQYAKWWKISGHFSQHSCVAQEPNNNLCVGI